jgi:hypothetical protein
MSYQHRDRGFASATRVAATFRQVCAPSSPHTGAASPSQKRLNAGFDPPGWSTSCRGNRGLLGRCTFLR